MRVIWGAAVSVMVLAATVLARGCGGGGDNDGKVHEFANKQITCTGPDGNRICRITLSELKAHGARCKINVDGSFGYHASHQNHLPFSISVAKGEKLMVDREADTHKARIADITLIDGIHCPKRPFLRGQPNGFGEELTGPPVDFQGHKGCVYEMAVQTQDERPAVDGDHPKDQDGHNYFCVDPHFEMIDVN